jgi:threonyl-tRNA synthetase
MQTTLEHKRHTLAHVLAAAVLSKYPHAKPTIGPAVDTGFYYDFDFSGGEKPSEADLQKLTNIMRNLLPTWTEFTHEEVSVDAARERFAGNPYKLELIEEITAKGEPITLYTCGGFTDLCRGGHAENPAEEIDRESFELEKVAGAYWRGDADKAMLTRIYGLAFETKDDLRAHHAHIEEAKKRDHRKIGKELDLFTFSELVGSGLPLYTPKGTVVRDELGGFSESLQKRFGFEKVWIPHITKIDLYKKSGHWDKFGHELMLVKSQESSDEFALKPMNCPHHTQIYASKPRSYRDLPVRLMETTTCYRDAHVFCRPDQIEQEFENIMLMIKELYGALGMSFKARLSFHDPENKEEYLGDASLWKMAEEKIEDVAKKLNLDYFVAKGEAAFYGPKIDVMVIDALGREWQCATEQLDFVQPERFELEYTDSDGQKKTPVMIHKALLGTLDRFMGVYIEHTAGNFPLWMAPVQVSIITVGEEQNAYAQDICNALKASGIRATFDSSNESLGKKIRASKQEKLPYFVVIGAKEVEANMVTLEKREGGNESLTKEGLLERLLLEIRLKK